ncbi:MAG: hypothetical protein QNJ55_12725 [Xenococcus sp. MO_188.B8]|nr:hypothetical protein [Xenococcus sp. MO_188.B8]
MSSFLLDAIPIWAIFIALFLILFGSVLVGFRLGQRRRRRPDELADKQLDLSGVALAAMLTLIGFLLAFTFSLAGSHFDTRRQLVIDDVNAIGGTFAGTELLQEPHRSNIKGLLIDYADMRATFYRYEPTKAKFDEFIQRSELLHEQMLGEGSAAANLEPTPVVATFINSLNTLIDIHTYRTNLRWNRIPPTIFAALTFLSTMAMILIGYIRGLIGKIALFPTLLLVITYVTVFTLIIDLDRPANGIFYVNQQPMIELLEDLQAK